jgi:hypothetical protein
MGWHGYVLVSGIPPGWTNEQRLAAFAALHGLGAQDDPQPAKNNHYRISLDQTEIIYEAEFDEAEITFDNICQVIADILSLPVAAIKAVVEVGWFGDIGSAWETSRAAARNYIIENNENWDSDDFE